MFTRKHYKAIAEIINGGLPNRGGDYESGYNNSRRDIAYCLADYFEQDSSRFDRQKFLDACDAAYLV